MNTTAIYFMVLGSESRSISELLTVATLQGNFGTAHVIHAQLGPGVLSKPGFPG
jgi:hypothetical protein